MKKFIPIYQKKRYYNYMFTLDRIDNKFKKEFVKRFRKDFQIAMQNNEIDKNLFAELEYYRLQLVIKNPDKFYRKYLNRMSLIEKMFSVKNRGVHKIVRIFGIKLKFKSNALVLKQQLNDIQQALNQVKNNTRTQNNKIKEIQNDVSLIKTMLEPQEDKSVNICAIRGE